MFSFPFSQALSRGHVLSFLIPKKMYSAIMSVLITVYTQIESTDSVHFTYIYVYIIIEFNLHCAIVTVFGMLYRKDWLSLFDMNYSPLISISCMVLHVQCPDYKKTRELFSSFLHKLNSSPLLGNCCTSDIERTGFFLLHMN